MKKICLHGNKRYQVRVERVFQTELEAISFENEFKLWEESRKHLIHVAGSPSKNTIKFFKLFDEFMQARKIEGISEATLDLYRIYIRKWHRFFGGRDPIAIHITREDIREFISQEMNEGKSPLYINKIHRVWRAAYKWGMEEGLISQPLPTIPLFSDARHQKKPEFLTLEEFDRLVEHARPDIRDLLIILGNTGIRRQMLRDLKCGDIDIEKRYLRIENSKRGERYITIPLTEDAIEVFTRHRVDKRPGDEKVFSFSYKILRRELHKAADEAQISREKAHPHAFRHTMGAHMARAKVPPEIRQKILGHLRITTTDHYSHVEDAPALLQEAIEKMDAWRSENRENRDNRGPIEIKTTKTG